MHHSIYKLTNMATKHISRNELEQLTPLPSHIEAGLILHRIGRYYCEILNRCSKCSRVCSTCKEQIINIIESATAEGVREPLAMLVWASREEAAKVLELDEEPGEGPARNLWGEPIDANPFELFRKKL
jgi:hypothetical protein